MCLGANDIKANANNEAVIVIDFFHWTRQGDWTFDPQAWPDPAGMVKRLEKLGVKVMVSVWPTVNRLSANYNEMWNKGYIIRNTKGSPAQMYFCARSTSPMNVARSSVDFRSSSVAR